MSEDYSEGSSSDGFDADDRFARELFGRPDLSDLGRVSGRGEDEFPLRFGEYVTLVEVGEGTDGVVFKAEDENGAFVAIKWLRSGFSTSEIRSSVTLLKEVRGLPRISVGEYEGRPYLVMPFYESGSLRRRIGDSQYTGPSEGLLHLAESFGALLAEFHRNNVTHGDFKPDNLLIDTGAPAVVEPDDSWLRDGERLVLLDFGTIRSELGEPSLGRGSKGYAPPELITGGLSHDPRIDIYSASITLIEAASGERPKQAASPDTSPFTGAAFAATGNLEQPLRRAVSFDPDARPDTVKEWLAELREAAEQSDREPVDEFASFFEAGTAGASVSKRRAPLWLMCGVLLVLLGGLAFWSTRSTEPDQGVAIDEPRLDGDDGELGLLVDDEPVGPTVSEPQTEFGSMTSVEDAQATDFQPVPPTEDADSTTAVEDATTAGLRLAPLTEAADSVSTTSAPQGIPATTGSTVAVLPPTTLEPVDSTTTTTTTLPSSSATTAAPPSSSSTTVSGERSYGGFKRLPILSTSSFRTDGCVELYGVPGDEDKYNRTLCRDHADLGSLPSNSKEIDDVLRYAKIQCGFTLTVFDEPNFAGASGTATSQGGACGG